MKTDDIGTDPNLPRLAPLWCALEEVMVAAGELGNRLDPAALHYLDVSLELDDAMQELQSHCPALLGVLLIPPDVPTTAKTLLARLQELHQIAATLVEAPGVGALMIGAVTRAEVHVLTAFRLAGGLR